jgi:hypothetical protein
MLKVILIAAVAASTWVSTDPKVCGAVVRDSDKTTLRSSRVLVSFKKEHPCPSNGKDHGPCSGWVMDHVIPLDCGGCDSVGNLQWLPTDVWKMKSKFERKIYGGHSLSVGCP